MDADRLRYVTQRYPQLQGLRLLPLAALFLLSAAWRAGWVHLPGNAARWFLAGLAVAIAASYPLRAWYAARFGTVSQRLTDSSLLPIVAVGACLPLARATQDDTQLAFSLPAALIAAAMAGVGLAHYPLRRHYLAAAAVVFGWALVRAVGVGADAGGSPMDADDTRGR